MSEASTPHSLKKRSWRHYHREDERELTLPLPSNLITAAGPANASVTVKPGEVVRAICLITSPADAVLTAGGAVTAAVVLQPGMIAHPVIIVSAAGEFTR